MKDYNAFIKSFMDSWKNLEGVKTCELMAKDLIGYYETPIDPPLTRNEDVKKLWEIVPLNQKDITYTYDILSENEEHCLFHFTMTRTMVPSGLIQNIDGVCEIKLNDENLLTFFKQWRFTKES